MAYIINRYDGTQLAIIDDGILDTSTPLGLIGRNYTGYGEVQNENFIFLLENFANDNPPARALSGQAWYDKSAKALKVYNGSNWLSIGNATVAENEPAHSNGGLWLNTVTNQLFISDGSIWRLVGPEGVSGFAVTKMTSTTIKDINGLPKPVIISQVNGETNGIISNEEFTIGTETPVAGFSKIYKGYNVKETHSFNGSLKGNADSASTLETPRKINSVDFDGSQDIIVRASTTNPLRPGDYIRGSSFDGSLEDTWNVDATPENLIGKVVARDSSGSFSATQVSAELFFGNLSGNVTATAGTSTFSNISVKTIQGDTFSGVSAFATRLENKRRINTVEFDGSQDITLPVPAETLVGSRLAPNVVDSSLTTVGKLISLDVEPAGITVGSGNNLKLHIESSIPTIESDTTNNIRLKLGTGAVTTGAAVINFISASAASTDGVISPAFVPEFNTSVPEDQRPVLGLPSYRWRNVYSKDSNTDTLSTNTITGNNPSDIVTVTKDLVVSGTTFSTVRGSLIGNVTGNVVGNVTGSASLNALKSGDTFTGDVSWAASGRGVSWSYLTDGASIKFYSAGDSDQNTRLEFNTFDNGNEYFLFTHTYPNESKINLFRLDPNDNFGNVKATVYGNLVATGTISANLFSGNGQDLTINASNLVSGNVPLSRLSGTYNISITGNAATATTAQIASANIQRAGDTMTGRLGQSTQGFHAVSIDNISLRTNSGFYDNPNPTIAKGWPVNGSWHHLLSSTHVNDANYYAMQFSADFYSQNLYYRSTNGSGNTAWSRILHSGNWNEYAPSRTGGGASGTWPISVSGNAATVTAITGTQVTNALGYVPVNPANLTNQAGGNISGTNFYASGTIYTSVQGLVFPNDPYGGGGDAASITLESVGGERMRLRFRVTNDGGISTVDDKAEFLVPDNDSLLINGNVVLNAANYNNYAPTRTGAGASGTWNININGVAASATTVPWNGVSAKPNNFVFNDGGTYGINISGTAASAASAPFISNSGTIAAESNGTAEPSYRLTLRSVYTNGYPTSYGNLITLGGAGGGELLIGWSGTTGAHADNYVRSRRDTGNTWSPWAKLITDVNYNSYSPSLTGVGAYGTWPINVTGNAETVTAVTRTQVTNALGYVPVNPADLTNQAGGNANFAEGTFQTLIVDRTGNAEIRFNSRGDSNQDLVISVQNENFIVYEPDDGNREWFRIDDTGTFGAGYIYGQKVLDARNYTDYVPTKTGTGASGTWPISISGNAATVSTITSAQITNALGFTPASQADLTRTVTSPLQASSAQFTGKVTVAAGATNGIHWPADSYGGSGDTARITLETAYGEATRMRFTMTNDADDMIEFNVPAINGVKINSWTVLNDGNTKFTSGAAYSTAGFTNQVGSFNYGSNYFDVFPPAGYTMSHIVAFIPSIHVIHFAGGVNGDDSLMNTYEFLSDRIRVRVQNTEQRSTPAANWLAIWRR